MTTYRNQLILRSDEEYNFVKDKLTDNSGELKLEQLIDIPSYFNVIFSDNDRTITWDTNDSDCGDLVEIGLLFCNNIEGYFRCAAEDCTYAAERFMPKEKGYFPMGGADVRYVKKTAIDLYNIYGQLFKNNKYDWDKNEKVVVEATDRNTKEAKNTNLLDDFLSGKNIFNEQPDWFYKG